MIKCNKIKCNKIKCNKYLRTKHLFLEYAIFFSFSYKGLKPDV